MTSVLLGHSALKHIKRDHPANQGRRQAIASLALGYPALLLSLVVAASAIVKRSPRDVEDSTSTEFGISESPNEAFKNAEYEIASKRDDRPGRGNNPKAVELANTFASRMKEISDEVFTSNRKPLLQLSDGEFLTYCQLRDDRCLFLVHVPSYRKYTKDAKKTLSELAWVVAQSTTAGLFEEPGKLGVGLRGVLNYGAILLGDVPVSVESKLQGYSEGSKDDLIAFFESGLPSSLTQSKSSISAAQDPFEPTADVEPVDTNPLVASIATPVPFAPPPKKSESLRPSTKPALEPEFVNQISIDLVRTIENKSWGTTSVALSPDGQWIALGKQDQKVLLYNVHSGQQVDVKEKMGELGQITSLAFSHDSTYLIAGGYSGHSLYWKVSTEGRLMEQAKGYRFESPVEQLLASPRFSFFMGAGRKGTIAWQPLDSTNAQPRILQEFTKEPLAIWLPSTGDLARATDGRNLVSFSLRNAQVSKSDPVEFKNIRFVSFSPSGERLVFADSNTLFLSQLDATSKGPKVELPPGQSIHALEFHPNQRWLAVGMRGIVGMIDYDQAKWVAYITGDSNQYINNVRFSMDGLFLVATSQTAGEPLRIYRIGDLSKVLQD